MIKRIPKIFLVFTLVSIFSISCSSDDSDDALISEKFDYYVSFRANGDLVEMGFNQSSIANAFQPVISSVSTSGCSSTILSPGMVAIGVTPFPQGNVSFYSFLEPFCADSDVFNTLFPVGDYSYSSMTTDIGVGFDYSLDDNTSYNTINGDQSVSRFSLTSSESENVLFPDGSVSMYRQIISGTFSCRLYNNQDSSDVLEITEGVFKLIVDAP